ncbi:MAG: hypothetical protein GXP29_03580, partial [Planctomycetes bacterium]|nr:hypothetical protein [Planctomycetota bacterium]
MTRLFGTVTTLVFTLSFASGVMACDKHKAAAEKSAAVGAVANAKSGCHSKTGATVVDQGVARVMKQMPQMTYKVGDFETPCAYTAASKAKDAGSPIAYLVGGKSFESKNDAMNQQASLMRAELANAAVVAPSVEGECIKCPVTASALAAKKNVKVKHMVAGIEFDSDKEARTVADKLA